MRGLSAALLCLGLMGCVPDPAAYPGAPYQPGPGYARPYSYSPPGPGYPGPGYPGPGYGYAEPGYAPGYGGGVVVVPQVGLGYGGERGRFDRERAERERFELERTRDRGIQRDGRPFGGLPPRQDRPYQNGAGARFGGPPSPQPAAGRPPPLQAARPAPAPPPGPAARPRRPDERG